MTENEAINVLKMVEAHGCLVIEAKVKAIQALEEIQAYRAIGTIDEFKALKEKSEPKKVAYQIDTSGHKHEKCPACGSFHVFGKHCTECGQSIIEWWK